MEQAFGCFTPNVLQPDIGEQIQMRGWSQPQKSTTTYRVLAAYRARLAAQRTRARHLAQAIGLVAPRVASPPSKGAGKWPYVDNCLSLTE